MTAKQRIIRHFIERNRQPPKPPSRMIRKTDEAIFSSEVPLVNLTSLRKIADLATPADDALLVFHDHQDLEQFRSEWIKVNWPSDEDVAIVDGGLERVRPVAPQVIVFPEVAREKGKLIAVSDPAMKASVIKSATERDVSELTAVEREVQNFEANVISVEGSEV